LSADSLDARYDALRFDIHAPPKEKNKKNIEKERNNSSGYKIKFLKKIKLNKNF
jgi:hypothetical protein